MKEDSITQQKTVSDGSLWRLIEQFCLQQGWSVSQLAEESGISRATLNKWKQQPNCQPQFKTLARLAEVMQINPAELAKGIQHGGSTPGSADESDPARRNRSANFFATNIEQSLDGNEFDRQSNWIIQEVCEEAPELFEDWTEEEWSELFSTFGVGGQLNRDGVRIQADAINKKRDTIYQLQVVLETHLADAARSVIRSLYESVRCNEIPGEPSDKSLEEGKAGP